MATTLLTSAASSYSKRVRNLSFHLNGSTATTGATWEGQGQWAVVRGGTIVHSEYGPLRFAWKCRHDGEQIKARFIDRSGNAGAWETYTCSLSAAAWSYEQWVDSATGNNTNLGTSSGAPVQTVAQARANIAANLVSGGDHVIWLREGQTHACGAASAWAGGTTPARVQFVRWGSSGARPVLQVNSGVSLLVTGMRQSIEVDDVDLDGTDGTSGFGLAVHNNRGGAGTKSSPNIGLRASVVRNFWQGIKGDEDQSTAGTRDAGDNDFLSLEDVTFQDNWEYHVFGFLHLRYQMLRRVTFGTHTKPGWQDAYRVYSQSDAYLEEATLNGGHNGSLRFQHQQGTGSGTRRMSITRCDVRTLDDSGNFGGIAFASEGTAGEISYVEDVEILNTRLDNSSVRWSTNFGPSGLNSLDVKRFRVKGCTLGATSTLEVRSGGGTYGDMDWSRNAWISTQNSSSCGLALQSTIDRYVDGGIRCDGNVAYWPVTGAGSFGPRVLIAADHSPRATVAGKFVSCARNLVAKVDANPCYIASHSDVPPWVSTPAQWQTATGWTTPDAVESTTLQLTHNGIGGLLDARPTGTGPRVDAGGPVDYEVDADGYLRGATADAGPFEWGATLRPDDPPPEGITGTIAGTLTPGGSLAGSPVASGGVAGTMSLLGGMVGTTSASGTISGVLGFDGGMAGTPTAAGTIAGVLLLAGGMDGTARQVVDRRPSPVASGRPRRRPWFQPRWAYRSVRGFRR